MLARGKQDFAMGECMCAAYMWVWEWGAGVGRQSRLMSEWWQLCNWCNYTGVAKIIFHDCLNPLGHGVHQSFTGCHWIPLPLLHDSITELVDVRDLPLLHLPFEDAPQMLNRVQVWRHAWPVHHLYPQHLKQDSGRLGGVFGVVIMLESCHAAQSLLQNVTVHVGIHGFFNEL